MLCFLLVVPGCSTKETIDEKGISVSGISSSIGGVGPNTSDFETQRFNYTITLTNNDEKDIKVVLIVPVLSEAFAEKVSDKNITVDVNKTISKGNSIDVTGEIIFDTKGLSKEQIMNLQPFVKEVKVIQEIILQHSF